jgi:DNA-directed RNA polymerase
MLTAVLWISKIVNVIADEVCRPVNKVMKFLKESIRGLGYDSPLMWTTPTGFKVIQSFRKTKKVSVASVFDNTNMVLHTEELANEIDPKGQQDAVTANFIHSLDACVVHQVANEVDFDAGYIHDCFVTHACNVRAMNRIVRETYTKTFTVDLLTEFRMEQVNTNPEAELPSVPELGDLDVSAITQMKYLLS